MNVIKNLTVWQNYVHYILLTGWIFWPTHYYSGFLEEKVVAGEPFAWILIYLWYVLFIFVGDTLIHLLFSVAPEPIKWDD